jgi:hypothetical protein
VDELGDEMEAAMIRYMLREAAQTAQANANARRGY